MLSTASRFGPTGVSASMKPTFAVGAEPSTGPYWLYGSTSVPLLAPGTSLYSLKGFGPGEKAQLASMRDKAFVGSPATVGAKLRQLASTFALDEVVVNTWAHDPAARRRSYSLLAPFGLVSPSA